MPARLSKTGQLAEEYGLTYACVKYRLEHGISLDAPRMPNGIAKAWQKRPRSTRRRGIRATPVQRAPQVKKAPQATPDETAVIRSGDRSQWQNPLAKLACGTR